MKISFLLILTILATACTNNVEDPAIAKHNITIDLSKKMNKVPHNPGGVVSCWLLDSDIERPRKTSFADAMKDMGVKYMRFPYGHLADNYLWDADGDWGNTLTPKIATFSRAPASWAWAVDSSSGAFIKDMDFDEYISICNDVGAEPMVVVNILSYKFPNGPTYEQLKESAVEWVRYANITKNYKVKRWALGNEIDHHPDFISLGEYKALYSDFATAMKAIDSTIWIGPGLLSKWHSEMLSYSPELIDFVCVHNYLYKYDWRHKNYEGWKNATDILVNNVEKCQDAVSKSSIPDIEIHVTEMNSRPWKDKSDNDDIFRALAYGEMLLNACGFENVKATYIWNTHGPWEGEYGNPPYNVLDLDNNREPRGEIIKLINENLLDDFVEVQRVSGFVRAFATVSENNDELILYLINKNDNSEAVSIDFRGFKPGDSHIITEFYGQDPYDENLRLSTSEKIKGARDKITVNLKPLSFNIIGLKNKAK